MDDVGVVRFAVLVVVTISIPRPSPEYKKPLVPVRDERLMRLRGTTLVDRCRRGPGGAEGTRTPYLNTASVALSRMSYSPRTTRRGCDPLCGPLTEATRRRLVGKDRFPVHRRGSRASSTPVAALHQPAAR